MPICWKPLNLIVGAVLQITPFDNGVLNRLLQQAKPFVRRAEQNLLVDIATAANRFVGASAPIHAQTHSDQGAKLEIIKAHFSGLLSRL